MDMMTCLWDDDGAASVTFWLTAGRWGNCAWSEMGMIGWAVEGEDMPVETKHGSATELDRDRLGGHLGKGDAASAVIVLGPMYVSGDSGSDVRSMTLEGPGLRRWWHLRAIAKVNDIAGTGSEISAGNRVAQEIG